MHKKKKKKVDIRKYITKELREAVKAKSDTCFYCGALLTENNRTIDHIVPITKGGTNDYSNLVCVCNDCNQVKGGQTLSGVIHVLKEKIKWCRNDFSEDIRRKEKYLNYIKIFENAKVKLQAHYNAGQ